MGIKNFITNVFFSSICVCCSENLPITQQEALCESCKKAFVPLDNPKIERPPLEAIVSCCKYSGAARVIVHKFKYKNRKDIGRFFAYKMANELIKYNLTPTVITYVPTRKNERGRFNQSKYLAKHIANYLNIPCICFLVKNRKTKSQTVCKTYLHRRQNVKGAFTLSDKQMSPINEKILIADDVFTTGATMSECANVLLESGAQCVYGVTFARTLIGAKESEINFEFSHEPQAITYHDIPYNPNLLLKKAQHIKKRKERKKRIDSILHPRKDNK
ncbi:MAG: hypothetical protein DBX47_03770 [Clostridiales bacterium]|nr:MAG: hypothetical protein DBX47_03770 [Clostridiales bacterium]